MPLPNSDKIRELNDKFRKGEDTSMPGKIVLTSGLLYLLEENDKASEDIVLLVRDFDEFTEDNDPHKEHDFGAFDFCGAKIFWKFDYYDPDIMHGSVMQATLQKRSACSPSFWAVNTDGKTTQPQRPHRSFPHRNPLIHSSLW